MCSYLRIVRSRSPSRSCFLISKSAELTALSVFTVLVREREEERERTVPSACGSRTGCKARMLAPHPHRSPPPEREGAGHWFVLQYSCFHPLEANYLTPPA